jgi:hypothetical protein
MRKLLLLILLGALSSGAVASGCNSYDRAVEDYNSLTNRYNLIAKAYNTQLDAYDDEIYIKVATFKMDEILGGLERPQLRRFLRSMASIQNVFGTALTNLQDIRDSLEDIEYDYLFDISGRCERDAKKLIKNELLSLNNMAYNLSTKYERLYDKYDDDIESLNELL